ncbi:MAG: FecR domain-containing protein, partial [Bacteroidota bacterium]
AARVQQYSALKAQLKPHKTASNNWLKPLIGIAAVLLIGFSIFYYTSGLDTTVETLAAEQTTFELPDNSSVDLNAVSSLVYNKRKWSNDRQVILDGEAFFKVAKGSKFDVKTKDGIVSVLGTEFNVKQRQNYFEVSCYEGLVSVTHHKKTIKLTPGKSYAVIDGKIITDEKENTNSPGWINNESRFSSRPLKYVIEEFQFQYNIEVSTKDIDTQQLFSGSFTHDNIDLALKSITLPLNLTYSKSGNTIVIKRE